LPSCRPCRGLADAKFVVLQIQLDTLNSTRTTNMSLLCTTHAYVMTCQTLREIARQLSCSSNVSERSQRFGKHIGITQGQRSCRRCIDGFGLCSALLQNKSSRPGGVRMPLFQLHPRSCCDIFSIGLMKSTLANLRRTTFKENTTSMSTLRSQSYCLVSLVGLSALTGNSPSRTLVTATRRIMSHTSGCARYRPSLEV